MDFGQAYVLVLTRDNMIVQLFQHNKLELELSPRCQAQRSSSPSTSLADTFTVDCFYRLILCSYKLQRGTSPMLGWSVLPSTFCSGQRAVRANQTVPTGFQSPSFVAPGLCRWRKAVLRSHGSVFSSAAVLFPLQASPTVEKNPNRTASQSSRTRVRYYCCDLFFICSPHWGSANLEEGQWRVWTFLFSHHFLFFFLETHYAKCIQAIKEETICHFLQLFKPQTSKKRAVQ